LHPESDRAAGKPLRAACVGITHPHASGRTRSLLRRGDVEIVAVADDSPLSEPFARTFSLPRREVSEVLADADIDFILAHGESKDNTDVAIAAVEAGKAVLVEKPGGQTLADLERLSAAVDAADGVVQVGYNFRFSKAVDFTRQALDDGLLGDVVQVRVHAGCSLGEHKASLLNAPGDIGGAFFVIGCHSVDLILHYFGLPNLVQARIPKFPAISGSDSREDAAAAILEYDDFILSYDFTSWDPMPWVEGWEVAIYGKDGALRSCPLPAAYELFLSRSADPFAPGWTTWSETSFPEPWAAAPAEYTPEIAEIANEAFFDNEAAAFIAAVRAESDVPISASHARDVVRVLEACFQSWSLDGQAIPLEKSAAGAR
jgi:predicted dehydrogenase